MIKISKIKSNPNNPRIIKDDKFKKLCKSISELPKMMELRPIVVDENFIVQGGNMRLKALTELGYKEIPDEWVKQAKDFTEDELKEFIIKDNVGFGEWDWSDLANQWDAEKLTEWGLDIIGFENVDDLGVEFSLPDGDKSPFQQMTFTLADEQANVIKNAIEKIKKSDEYKYCETFGNENGNGNALYLIVSNLTNIRI
jgi:hypothetical protein